MTTMSSPQATKKSMNIVCYAWLTLAVLGASGLVSPTRAQPTSGRSVMVDRVAAVVNTQVILESEVQRRMRQSAQTLAKSGQKPPPTAVFREQVLDRMITDLALVQRASQLGVTVDETTLTRAIGTIAQQNGLTVTGLRDQLEKEGTPFERFREDIREEILLARLREREVDNRVRVSDAEVDALLASRGQSLASEEELLVRQILIAVTEAQGDARARSRDQARRIAEDLLTKIKRGEDFAELARLNSNSPDAPAGGSLGWRTAARIPSLFLKSLEGAQVGAVIGPIDSGGGVHLLKLEDRRSRLASQLVDVYRARHILIRVDEQTSEPLALRRLAEVKRRLSLGEDFGALAREISQDPGSAARGGELDWAYPGDMVPEFERAAMNLRVREVSEAVRSVFGFHLIEVLEKRREPLTEDRLRLAARMALRERKLGEAVDEWTREVRANTFVETKKSGE